MPDMVARAAQGLTGPGVTAHKDPINAAATFFIADALAADPYSSGGYPGTACTNRIHAEADGLTDATAVADGLTTDHQRQFRLMPTDWTYWDAPASPDGGFLYGFDAYTNTLLYRVPVDGNAHAGMFLGSAASACLYRSATPGTNPACSPALLCA
jgi:hypothetical protein